MYKKIQTYYVDHNVSITVSYDPSEVPDIIEWILDNWDSYVATSFLFRADPTKTAADLGYKYLPQEVVTKSQYDEYVSKLLPIDFDNTETFLELVEDECATGACPIK
jgi:ribonucleoside-triphosphate reductase